MLIKAIDRIFSPSRVELSKELRLRGFGYLKKELNKVAHHSDVYVRLSSSEKNPGMLTMEILRKKFEHVADVPEYAVKHQTGDSVYVAVEKSLVTKEIKPFDVLKSLKNILKIS